jgi:hypothetical protein
MTDEWLETSIPTAYRHEHDRERDWLPLERLAFAAGSGSVSKSIQEAGGEGRADAVRLGDRCDLGPGMLVEPSSRVGGGGEVLHLVTEGRTDPAERLGRDQGHHRGSRLDVAHPYGGIDGDADRLAAGRGDRLDARGAIEEGGEDQGVQGAPGVERFARDREPVDGGAQG